MSLVVAFSIWYGFSLGVLVLSLMRLSLLSLLVSTFSVLCVFLVLCI
jgi:hypothetical protein